MNIIIVILMQARLVACVHACYPVPHLKGQLQHSTRSPCMADVCHDSVSEASGLYSPHQCVLL